MAPPGSLAAGGPARRAAPYQVVVFDWDGTLVDSTPLIADAILRAASDIGVPVPDRALAAHVIGLGLAEALARVVPDLPRERIGDFAARYHVHFRQGEAQIRFFDGAVGLLDTLRARGVQLAVATGKSRAGLGRALQAAGLEAHFSAVRCADQTHPKPHPAMLHELSDELAVAPAAMLMIGDTSHDLQMAAAAGVGAVGVSYGAHPRHELERLQPLAVVDTPSQLREWLLARL